ncbi:glycoside hydrolase family 76 protein [Raineyella fluvialis]|uniref:Fructose-bisphosphate aldolase n=1 Tax=Raineyella fluvialis TaxID=2662261 RepID=A0A5Q2FEV1_9ACTN|nr:glycoside hydrolase family 76 protein [Raineyella fluvialis]QGF23613.1 fructose-bisphosphate aldolase [Raineyella fluvialis]
MNAATSGAPVPDWAARAAAAERSVAGRHLHRPWLTPWARLAWTAHPPTLSVRSFVTFHYWWQAQVLDCLLDAQVRAPTPERRRMIARWPAVMALHNGAGWLNQYYDDNAWLGLALDRMQRELGIVVPARWGLADLPGVRRVVAGRALGRPGGREPGRRALAVDRIVARLEDGWAEQPLGGGIPWRLGDAFRNTPANGPMTILLARRGRLDRARDALEWMRARYPDPATGLMVDGIRPDPSGATPWLVDRAFYTYNQGVVLGAEVAVLRAALDRGLAGAADIVDTASRVLRLVEAIERWMADGHVLVGYQGQAERGGDEGLFRGILARYLTLVATDLPGQGDPARAARRLAATLVRTTADACWEHRAQDGQQVWFGPDARVPARVPRRSDAVVAGASAAGVESAAVPERDLSVQVGAWMLLEAAARCPREDPTPA